MKKENTIKKESTAKTENKKQVKKQEEKKVEKVTLQSKTEQLKKSLVLKDSIEFENDKTAVNKEDSATVLHDNCIMLTQTSENKESAKRILEIWIHKNTFDVCIAKKLYNALKEKSEAFAKYDEKINEKKSKSKVVLVLDEKEIKAFANLFVKLI